MSLHHAPPSITLHSQERILKHKYRCLADMEDDMMLLCQNACKYNQEGSQIYTDAQELERAFLASRVQIDSVDIDFGGGDSGGEEDTLSQMTTSSTQSPAVHIVEVEGYLSDNSDGELMCVYISTIHQILFSCSSLHSCVHPSLHSQVERWKVREVQEET